MPALLRHGPNVITPRRLEGAHTLAAVRRRFLMQGAVGEGDLPASILRSWQRCAALGLRMDMRPEVEAIGRGDLRERFDRAESLRAAASGEIRMLHEEAAGAGGVVILTDAEGVLLEVLGDPAFAEKASRVALRPGVAWVEATTGTNAIGTALAERREISVVGAEHFFENHRILSCTAAPIVDGRGTMRGVLDLSNEARVQPLHAPALVRRAVASVERRLFEAGFAEHELVRFGRDPSEIGGMREGLLAFEGDRLVGANRVALEALDLDWSAIDRCRWSDLFAVGRRQAEAGELVSARGRVLCGRLAGPVSGAKPARAVAPRPAETASPRRDRGRTAAIVWDEATSRASVRATRLVDADVPVLIQGETGAGKEVFARTLHAASRRAGQPFVAINCAALPEGLIEAELFGYEEGAFTGARRKGSKGLLREADGGVLFLDEIGDMPLALQARLLRALQEREVTPLGGGRPVAVDFALVCATHRGLGEAVAARSFRQDLYFRIAQYTVELKPLRERADLAGLIDRLWADVAGDERIVLSAAMRDRLAAYDWPGNFRQLTATLRTLAVLAEPGETLDEEALPADIRHAGGAATAHRPETDRSRGVAEASPRVVDEPRRLDDLNRVAMRAALDACGGNVTRAAARLGVHRSTLHRRLLGDRN